MYSRTIINRFIAKRKMSSRNALMDNTGKHLREFYRIKYFAMGYTYPSNRAVQPTNNHNAHVTAYYKLLWAQIEEYAKESLTMDSL